MPRINIYVSDADHASMQTAMGKMKGAGTSLSALVMQAIKTSAFWPKAKKVKQAE